MMENVTKFKAALAAVLAAMTALWGWFGWLVLAWVGCMAIDYITGYSAAAKNGEWSSKIAREGLWLHLRRAGGGHSGRCGGLSVWEYPWTGIAI